MMSSDKKNDLKKFITKDINLWLTRIAGTMLPSVAGITLETEPCCDNYIVLIVFNSVSGNNQIGLNLPVDNLKTGKARNTFPTTYGELDIFQVSLPHFTRRASWKYFFTRGASCLEKGTSWFKRGRVGGGELSWFPLYYPITLEWHEQKNCISVMCSVSWSFTRTRSVLNRIMLRVLRILFFSTHPLKFAKFTEMRKSNVLALICMMWDTLMLKLIAKKWLWFL
jgi:hypothetical protein